MKGYKKDLWGIKDEVWNALLLKKETVRYHSHVSMLAPSEEEREHFRNLANQEAAEFKLMVHEAAKLAGLPESLEHSISLQVSKVVGS